MKRNLFLASLFTLTLCLCLLFVSCGDDTEEPLRPSEGLEYALSEDGTYYTLTGIGTCTDSKVVIPGEYNGLPVRMIGKNAFENCNTVRSVVIMQGITRIDDKAFWFCESLRSIEMSDSMAYIGNNAFQDCDGLASVTIGNGVKTIGEESFSDCLKLTSINIPSSVTSIGKKAFASCTNLASIEVDENNANYKSIDGSLYTKDGRELIQYAIGKTEGEFTLPSEVESICDYAFYNCLTLTNVKIPKSVKTIGENVFYGCAALVISCENSGRLSDCDWHEYWNLMEYNGSSGKVKCPVVWDYNHNDRANDGNTYTVIDGVRYCIDDFFCNATVARQPAYLTEAEIPSYVVYKKISYPVRVIDAEAFSSCSNLTRVVVPSSVRTVDGYAFLGCKSVTVYCEAKSKADGWSDNWNRINSSGSKILRCPAVWNYNNNDVADDGAIYTMVEGIRYSIKNERATVVRQIVSLSKARINEKITYKDTSYPVTSIDDYAFENCFVLEDVVLPNGLTSIGEYAFANCVDLTGLELPSSITRMGKRAFSGCESLTSFTIPSDITVLSEGVLAGCENITELEIPSNITTIESWALAGCYALKDVTVPNSLTDISDYAFSHCSSLTSVKIPSSVTYVGSKAFINCHRLTIYCEAEEKPNQWHGEWNSTHCPVEWGHKQDN
ncbi:MAG: leucine-rich repeat protein [Clostridia bacterium]|nr:leucine-rich repeat protein [Clostridia bacterium]